MSGRGHNGALALTPFRPRAPWWSGDLQTLRNMITGVSASLAPWPAEEAFFETADGSGDIVSALFHKPTTDTSKPSLVLVHGLTGSAESSIVCNSASAFLQAGHKVARLNLRAAPPIAARCRILSHAGKTDDLRDLLAALPSDFTQNGVIIMGFSLGGNACLKLAGEGDLPSFVQGVVSVSAPIDLYEAQMRISKRRNLVYHRFLLRGMIEGTEMSGIDPAFKLAAQQCQSIMEFDDKVVAPLHGFDDARHYYRVNSAQGFIPEINVPALIIHAEDDPWIPPHAYRTVEKKLGPNTQMFLTKQGGHVGFHGQGSQTTWHDLAALRFADYVAR